ncbi:MAG: thioredoxin [bacterium]|nr:thioredoxin [bacterium]
MSNAIDIDDNNFEKEVLNNDSLTVVDFWAPWCGPCRKMGPVLDEIAEEFKDKIKVVKINTDENLKTATEYQISSLPSVFIFKNGEAKETMVGLMPKSAIVSNIQKYL